MADEGRKAEAVDTPLLLPVMLTLEGRGNVLCLVVGSGDVTKKVQYSTLLRFFDTTEANDLPDQVASVE